MHTHRRKTCPIEQSDYDIMITHITMNNVVLFFQSTVNKSWRDKLTGVYRYARKVDWQIQVLPISLSPTELRQQVKLWDPLGCLIDRGMTFSRCPISFFRQVPSVYLDQNPRKAPSEILNVVHDSAACAHAAIAELKHCDCNSYLYYAGSIPAFWIADREQAFREDMAMIGKPFTIIAKETDIADALIKVPKPCGVFAAYDSAAQQVIAEANRLRISIPGDLYVVGIDNDELICENTRPALTSVLPDFERAGYELAKLLDAKIKNPELNSVTLTYGPNQVFRRETTRKLSKTDIRVQKTPSISSAITPPATIFVSMKLSRS